jgi:hypothetical protein
VAARMMSEQPHGTRRVETLSGVPYKAGGTARSFDSLGVFQHVPTHSAQPIPKGNPYGNNRFQCANKPWCSSSQPSQRRNAGPKNKKVKGETNMKRVTIAIAFAAAVIMIAGSMSTHAGDNDGYYKDLYELKQLHLAFHNAVSHAGIDPATQASHLADILALWTDDGTITILSTGKTYSGKGAQVPDMFECVPDDGMTLCDFYVSAGPFQLGHNWVSLTPIFTEYIRLVDGHDADIYFQCIYFDVTTTPVTWKSNVTFGLPGTAGMPGSWTPAHAWKVEDKWLLHDAQVLSIAQPTLDVSPNP